MKVVMFMPRFEEPILAGTKRQTIRFPRKRPIVPGDILSLRKWSGRPYASKQVELGQTYCYAVAPIKIDWEESLVIETPGFMHGDGRLAEFARLDGFRDADDMARHWAEHNGFPFEGVVIKWGCFQRKGA